MRVLVVGLNALGRTLALELAAARNRVTVVDREEIRVSRIAARVDGALVMDANDRTALAGIDLPSFDEVVVCMSHQFDHAQIAVYLIAREFGHPAVTAFATTRERRAIMQRIGARRVISPGIFQARNLAVAITDPLLEGFTFLSPTQGTAEVELEHELALDPAAMQEILGAGIRLIGYRRRDADAGPFTLFGDERVTLAPHDAILVFGEPSTLGRFVRRRLQ